MKKTMVLTLVVMMGLSLAATAQTETDPWPVRIVSKEVNKMQHSKKTYTPARVLSGNADWVVSKGTARLAARPTAVAGVKMTGQPTWFISKGVAKMQVEK